MSEFESALKFVLAHEGGFVNNPNDPGGATNKGISLRFLKGLSVSELKEFGIFEEPDIETIRNLSDDQVAKIYLKEFWEVAPFERIQSQELCNYLFDMSVNLGVSPAIKCVQRATWAIMKLWENLIDDGILGEKTLTAIKMCGWMLLPVLRAERANFYRNLVDKYPEKKEFLNGWYNRTYRT